MLEKPLYNIDDRVFFEISKDGDTYMITGKVYAIDRYGTFEQHEEVSYDIMVDGVPWANNTPALFKHIEESHLTRI